MSADVFGRVVHDAMSGGDPGDIPPQQPIRTRCPSCSGWTSFDPRRVITDGRSLFDREASGLLSREVLEERLATLGLVPTLWNGQPFVQGTAGLSIQLLPIVCSGCRRDLFAVASYGEFQPMRWMLAAEGVIDAMVPE